MRPVPCSLTAASSLLITGSGYIVYWAALDSGNSGGSQFNLWDGQNASGQLLVPVSLTDGESTSEYIGKRLVFYTKSLYFDLVSGGVTGSVTVHACDSAEELQRLIAALGTLQDIAGMTPGQ